MPRRVQDIVPGDRRSIRDIPARKGPPQPDVRERTIKIHRVQVTPPLRPPAPPRRKRTTRKLWPLIVLGTIVVVAGAGFIGSALFSRADFTIVARSLPFSVNGTFVANPTPAAGSLTYQLIPLTATATSTVPATDGPLVSAKAQGMISIRNSYSASAQRLVAGTRFATNNGLIYRLTSSVIVPGYSSNSAGAMVPGSLSTSVVADQPGATYNISGDSSPVDLSIAAYAGTPRYQSLYGVLSGALSGGFVGHQKIVAASVLASTTASLKSRLLASLLAQAQNQTPEGYILYANAYIASFGVLQSGGNQPGVSTESLTATFYGIALDKNDLIQRLAGSDQSASFGSFSYTAPGLDTLQSSVTNPKDFQPDGKSTLLVSLKGSFKLVGTVPVDELKRKFAGASLAETQDILKPYGPVIESGSGELTPPWAHVPTDISRISITVR